MLVLFEVNHTFWSKKNYVRFLIIGFHWKLFQSVTIFVESSPKAFQKAHKSRQNMNSTERMLVFPPLREALPFGEHRLYARPTSATLPYHLPMSLLKVSCILSPSLKIERETFQLQCWPAHIEGTPPDNFGWWSSPDPSHPCWSLPACPPLG